MKKISRIGDTDTSGGKIIRGANTVFADGIAVGLHLSDVTSHGNGKHKSSKTTEGSPTVFVEGIPVLRVGSSTDCGHQINSGSSTVFVS